MIKPYYISYFFYKQDIYISGVQGILNPTKQYTTFVLTEQQTLNKQTNNDKSQTKTLHQTRVPVVKKEHCFLFLLSITNQSQETNFIWKKTELAPASTLLNSISFLNFHKHQAVAIQIIFSLLLPSLPTNALWKCKKCSLALITYA